MNPTTEINLNKLQEKLRLFLTQRPRWLVAVSGGVDSAVLLAEAAGALGPEKVLAVTGTSPAVPEIDRLAAADLALRLGVRHRFVETRELAREAYRRNGTDRCFHCRTELFSILKRVAAEAEDGYRVAYGAIVDDLGDHRPGMQAAERLGIAAPLLECGLGKAEVRQIARFHGLAVSEKPAAACLASRIRTGIPVTAERLRQVEMAELALARLGFAGFRVRHHGELARIELGPGGFERLQGAGVRESLADGVAGAGFRFVTVDLMGYRPAGSATG